LEDRFEHLEREARQAEHKGSYVGEVRHMLSYVPEYDGLGDFDELIKRLKNLESDLVGELDRKRRQKFNAKEALIAEAERWSYSTDWKSASAELRLLQTRWKAVGSAGVEEERLWQHFRSACDRFFQRRSAHFEELNHERARNASLKEELISIAESLRHSDDLKSAAGRVKNLQQQWKGIGPASKDLEPRLWDRFRHACDQGFEASHREWERKNREWRDRMHDVLRAKREQVSRLRGSIEHDQENISRWRHTIHNLRPGGRADEIENSLEGKIVDVEDRIASKEEKLREIENAIDEIEEKLRR
jgi:chromosome segregation ATPase